MGGTMPAVTETGLYELLEALLKESTEPRTCVELWDNQSVRDIAGASTRVSDYLGHLWRRGKVTRQAAVRTPNDNSRWAYAWRADAPVNQPGAMLVSPMDIKQNKVGKLNKLDMQITYDDDSVTINLPNMTITIQHK